jgi:hypothetical protein
MVISPQTVGFESLPTHLLVKVTIRWGEDKIIP